MSRVVDHTIFIWVGCRMSTSNNTPKLQDQDASTCAMTAITATLLASSWYWSVPATAPGALEAQHVHETDGFVTPQKKETSKMHYPNGSKVYANVPKCIQVCPKESF